MARKIDPKEYVKQALKTESRGAYAKMARRLRGDDERRLLHGVLGLTTESAEVADLVKKYLFYGKEFEVGKMVEEIGDILWYIAVLSDVMCIPIDEIMAKNIVKLRARYGDKFTEEKAIKRTV